MGGGREARVKPQQNCFAGRGGAAAGPGAKARWQGRVHREGPQRNCESCQRVRSGLHCAAPFSLLPWGSGEPTAHSATRPVGAARAARLPPPRCSRLGCVPRGGRRLCREGSCVSGPRSAGTQPPTRFHRRAQPRERHAARAPPPAVRRSKPSASHHAATQHEPPGKGSTPPRDAKAKVQGGVTRQTTPSLQATPTKLASCAACHTRRQVVVSSYKGCRGAAGGAEWQNLAPQGLGEKDRKPSGGEKRLLAKLRSLSS